MATGDLKTQTSDLKTPAVTILLSARSFAKLDSIARDAEMTKAKVAALLLDELLPTVQSVRTRLQITRTPSTKD